MFTLGINLSHHSSIALLEDNKVLLFLHEERLNRKKYFHGIPYRSLDLIKNYTRHIDVVSYVSGSDTNLTLIIQHLAQQGVTVKTYFRDNSKHHLAHAAAGFYMSHFDRAEVIVIDGAGAIYTLTSKGDVRASETTSTYTAVFPKIVCSSKRFVAGLYDKKPLNITSDDKNKFGRMFSKGNIPITITTQHDIGWKYAVVTHQIGFGVFGEGKTMGLSAYGSLPEADANSKKALAIQRELESHFLMLASRVKESNLVISGGCALNILGNSLIKQNFPNLNIFIDPIAADGTIALGAAAYEFYSNTSSTDKLQFTAYQGPEQLLEKNYIYECARKYSI
jgi:predicted NodU family carbamoyl transferase